MQRKSFFFSQTPSGVLLIVNKILILMNGMETPQVSFFNVNSVRNNKTGKFVNLHVNFIN